MARNLLIPPVTPCFFLKGKKENSGKARKHFIRLKKQKLKNHNPFVPHSLPSFPEDKGRKEKQGTLFFLFILPSPKEKKSKESSYLLHFFNKKEKRKETILLLKFEVRDALTCNLFVRGAQNNVRWRVRIHSSSCSITYPCAFVLPNGKMHVTLIAQASRQQAGGRCTVIAGAAHETPQRVLGQTAHNGELQFLGGDKTASPWPSPAPPS